MKHVRWNLANLAGATLSRLGIDRLLHDTSSKREFLTVLTYHRVAEAEEYPQLDPSLISASPDQFGRQLDYLGEHFSFISGAQLLASLAGEQELPRAPLLITFDDGYIDFEKNAWPQLKAKSVPAVQFITTQAVETGEAFWWDKLHSLLVAYGNRQIKGVDGIELPAWQHETKKQLKESLKQMHPYEAVSWVDSRCREAGFEMPERSVLDWQTLKRLNDAGLEVGPHTRTHPIITHLDGEEITQEIVRSYDDLKQNLSSVLPMFAYPSGYVDEKSRHHCSKTPMEMAFTTRFGANALKKCDRWLMRRINVSAKAEAPTLGLQVALANLMAV